VNGQRKLIDLDALARARREARAGRDEDSGPPETPRLPGTFARLARFRLMPRADLLAPVREQISAAVSGRFRDLARRLSDRQAMTRKQFRARFTELSRKKQRCKACDRQVSAIIRCRDNDRGGKVALVVHVAAPNRYYLTRRRMESPAVTCPEHGITGFPDRSRWRYLHDTEYVEPLQFG
jgi:hypothetical protein